MKGTAIAYLDHIHACNNADLSQFRPFHIGGRRLGWIGDEFAAQLAGWPAVFDVAPEAVSLSELLGDFDSRSAAVAEVVEGFAVTGGIDGWRAEAYPVKRHWSDPPLLQMERAACCYFGVRGWGVHMNGFVRRNDGLHLWVATRARNKTTYPGMLDNTVAGGQPIGIGFRDNMIKECAEEAGIPPNLAESVRCVGAVSFCHQIPTGVQPDQAVCFDLELPGDFIPENQDGEMEKFELWPIEEVAARVRSGFDFKYDCNLVIIDFLIRHGIVTPENEPDYMAILHGLRRGD